MGLNSFGYGDYYDSQELSDSFSEISDFTAKLESYKDSLWHIFKNMVPLEITHQNMSLKVEKGLYVAFDITLTVEGHEIEGSMNSDKNISISGCMEKLVADSDELGPEEIFVGFIVKLLRNKEYTIDP